MGVSSKISPDEAQVTITIDGRFDFNLHREFRNAYMSHPSNAAYSVDLAQADYLDSSALGMLLLLREHAGGEKAQVSITGSKPEIRKVLSISNFERLFSIA